MSSEAAALRQRLWSELGARPELLARAAQAYLGRPPEEDEWPELLDFAATEWLDDEGYTLAERLDPRCAAWPGAVRSSLWVVDGVEGDEVRLRDLQDDHPARVHLPGGAGGELVRRTILRARLVPWDGRTVFFGEPASYGEQGVLARLQLLEAWRQGPEPSCLGALALRRQAFVRQRLQHRAWRAHFGADVVVFDDAAGMESALAAFLDHLIFQERGPDGATRAERWAAEARKEPVRVELVLGESLRRARPAAWFDATCGVAFLPADELPPPPHDARLHPCWSVPVEPSSLPELGDEG